MAEEDKAPKKVARKRVVKKGVRGTRAPRKKTVVKKEESSVENTEAAGEDNFDEENETTCALETGDSAEPVREIEVVEDEEKAPRKRESSGKGRSENGERKKDRPRKEKSSDDSKEDDSEQDSVAEDEDRKEGRSRRGGRNRRGGNSREREDSGSKRAPVDKDEAAAKAWEIYQGELEEEGVSLVDPRRAREVARRCLELATIFCEERDRYLER